MLKNISILVLLLFVMDDQLKFIENVKPKK